MYSCPLHNWYSDYGQCPSCCHLTTTADGTQPYKSLEQQLQSEKLKVSKLREALDKILGSMSLERVERFDLKTLAEQTLKETE